MNRPKKFSVWLLETKTYIFFLLVQYLVMVAVPALAELGIGTGKEQLTGLQMLFWVNLFALLGIYPIYILSTRFGRKSSQKIYLLKQVGIRDWAKLIAFSLVFPFLYSVFYFVSLEYGPPSLTSVGSRLSILVYIPMSILLGKRKETDWKDNLIILVTFTMACVISYSDIADQKIINWIAIPLVIMAGIAAGVRYAYVELWRNQYDPVLITLVMEIVTVIVIVPILIAGGNLNIPQNAVTLTRPLIIGFCANAIGFWMSIEGFQRATLLSHKSHKIIYLVVSSGVLFIGQIAVVSLLKAENIGLPVWISSLVLALAIAWYSVASRK